MKPFPLAVSAIFVVFAIGAVLVFATYSASSNNAVGRVLVWGSLTEKEMSPALKAIDDGKNTFDGITYKHVNKEELITNLVAAIASGKGPDLVLFPEEYLLSEGDKLITIPYSSYSRRDFLDTFIEAGEVFLDDDGLKGVPFSVDPLVMYWNRTLFSGAGIAQPPRYWDEVTAIAPQLSPQAPKGTLVRSAISFGTWENVDHAKGIFVSLFNQLGNKVVEKKDGKYASVLNAGAAGAISSSDSALRFYTDFADPVKPIYSWNRSQPGSRDSFIAGKVAMYIGRASELYPIRAQNPNLNFDVAPVPSIRGGGASVDAHMVALSVPRGSKNPKGALLVIGALTSLPAQTALEENLHTPSVRRDAVASGPENPYFSIFKNAALASFSFPDPNPSESDAVFRRMVEGVSSGELTVTEAMSKAAVELSALIPSR
jgi:ABC-type glycerol-3-phosphate transport system substrate-binding protein